MYSIFFSGDPKAPLGTIERKLYQQGVHMGCWGMCIFAFSAALSAGKEEKHCTVFILITLGA